MGNGTTNLTIEKAHGCDPVGFQNDTINTPIIAAAEKIGNPDKTLATLIAQFALAGHVVHKGECGDFTVTRWGLARYCQDLEALQAFARQVGVQS